MKVRVHTYHKTPHLTSYLTLCPGLTHPVQDPAVSLALALDPSKVQPIDVGAVNGHPFVNVALAGAAGEVTASEANSWLKRLLGPLGIVVHGE